MKGLVKCFKLQQTRSSTRITSNDRHNTCHAKLSKCCGKLYPSSAIHPSLPAAAAAACRPGASNVLADAFDWFQYQLHIHRMGVRRSYTRIFTQHERPDGWMDRWKDERKARETAAGTNGGARCTLLLSWKATTVFIQFSPDVANALKTFRPKPSKRAKRKY